MKNKASKLDTKTKSKGYMHIYTGNGKGKTTAALGLSLRAAGHGQRVYFGQFLKGQMYGELLSLKSLANLITIEQFGRKGFIHVTKDADEEDKEEERLRVDEPRAELSSALIGVRACHVSQQLTKKTCFRLIEGGFISGK